MLLTLTSGLPEDVWVLIRHIEIWQGIVFFSKIFILNGASAVELITDFCPTFILVSNEDKSVMNFNAFIFSSESRSVKFSCSIEAWLGEICDFNCTTSKKVGRKFYSRPENEFSKVEVRSAEISVQISSSKTINLSLSVLFLLNLSFSYKNILLLNIKNKEKKIWNQWNSQNLCFRKSREQCANTEKFFWVSGFVRDVLHGNRKHWTIWVLELILLTCYKNYIISLYYFKYE